MIRDQVSPAKAHANPAAVVCVKIHRLKVGLANLLSSYQSSITTLQNSYRIILPKNLNSSPT